MGTTGSQRVDGVPTTPTEGTFAPQLRIPRRESTVTYDLQGAAERYADVAILRLDVLGAPENTSRQDPNAELTGTLVLPEGPAGEITAYLHGTRDPQVTVEGSTVRFSGEAPVWNSAHSLDVSFPPDRVPNVAIVPIPFLASFQVEQQTRDAADTSLNSTLDDLDTGVEMGRWVVTGLAFGIPASCGGARSAATRSRAHASRAWRSAGCRSPRSRARSWQPPSAFRSSSSCNPGSSSAS